MENQPDRPMTHREHQRWQGERYARLVRIVVGLQREQATMRAEQNRQAAIIRDLGPMLENIAHRAAEATLTRADRMGFNQYPVPQRGFQPVPQRGFQPIPQPGPRPGPQPGPRPGPQPGLQPRPQPAPQHVPQPVPQPVLQSGPQPHLQPNIQAPARETIPERKQNNTKPTTGISKKRGQRRNVTIRSTGQGGFIVGSVRQQRDSTFQPEAPVNVRNLAQRKNPGRSSRHTKSYFPTPTPFPEG
ncbi:hypothetical protein KCU78_g12737, partial [Aureobasidium melanogenum]